MNLFDVHTHLNLAAFDKDREEVLRRHIENGVFMVNSGTSFITSQKAIEIAAPDKGVFASVGIHPNNSYEPFFDSQEHTEPIKAEIFNEEFLKLAENKSVAGIGETGLDFYYLPSAVHQGRTKQNSPSESFSNSRELENDAIKIIKQKQGENFIKQIEAARELNKPLIIHCRNAYGEAIEVLKNYPNLLSVKPYGMLHFFTGSIDIAKKFIELGFLISLSGVITFAKELEPMVYGLPLDKIVVETDAPYAAPVPYRGKRNEPFHVREVVEKIAEIKDIHFQQAEEQIFKNASSLFRV